MRTRIAAIALSLFAAFTAAASSALPDPLLSEPDFYSGNFHAIAYVRLAAELQALSHEKALERIYEIARDRQSHGQAIILCRMLFEKRDGEEYRRPYLGDAVFMGGTNYSDWPLEPITLVDGIPFLITKGYILGGLPESDAAYVDYSVARATWTAFRFTVPTKKQEHAALTKVLFLPKWKKPLTEEERGMLAGQLE
jgi:hypothetical protein